jgi:hypothetical protein
LGRCLVSNRRSVIVGGGGGIKSVESGDSKARLQQEAYNRKLEGGGYLGIKKDFLC